MNQCTKNKAWRLRVTTFAIAKLEEQWGAIEQIQHYGRAQISFSYLGVPIIFSSTLRNKLNYP